MKHESARTNWMNGPLATASASSKFTLEGSCSILCAKIALAASIWGRKACKRPSTVQGMSLAWFRHNAMCGESYGQIEATNIDPLHTQGCWSPKIRQGRPVALQKATSRASRNCRCVRANFLVRFQSRTGYRAILGLTQSLKTLISIFDFKTFNFGWFCHDCLRLEGRCAEPAQVGQRLAQLFA